MERQVGGWGLEVIVPGFVESVGLNVGIRLLTGSLIAVPRKGGVFKGQRVNVVFITRNEHLTEIKEWLRKGGCGLAEALVLCYDPDADYSNNEFIDFEILEPPSGQFWNQETGVITGYWFEDDPYLL